MLTRFVRIQLTIFTIASIVGLLAMAFFYMQVPTLLGLGRMTVTLELPAAGGLYRFGNVTYRGVQVGKVTGIELTRDGAEATLSLDSSAKIPADLQAEVRSVSAVGEQYVDLRPRTDSPPYLHDGSVIAKSDTTIPQEVGPMLDQVSALIDRIPKDKLNALLDESFTAFNGAGYDFGSLVDSSAELSEDLNRVGDNTATLFNDSGPLLDTQVQTADSIRTWARSLAGVTEQLVTNDPQIRTVLQEGPGAFDQVSALLSQIRPTLPVLLSNLTTLGQVLVTYNPSLEQLLVLLPPSIGGLQAVFPSNNPTGYALGDFAVTISDPPPCTVGFLPPSLWRSPADQTTIDTPDGIYCKLPQDSPILVRGARNNPCMGVPGKRAPTAEMCYSDKEYQPLAMRQHALGPYPFDPNLVSQGVPLDDRVTFGDNIYAPTEGTPMPPNVAPAAPPPEIGLPLPGAIPENVVPTPLIARPPAAPPPPGALAAPPAVGDLAPAAGTAPSGGQPHLTVPAAGTDPSGRQPHLTVPAEGLPPGPAPEGSPEGAAPQAAPVSPTTGPSAAVASYDPRTGRYVGTDGQLYDQVNLGTSAAPQTWQDMLPK